MAELFRLTVLRPPRPPDESRVIRVEEQNATAPDAKVLIKATKIASIAESIQLDGGSRGRELVESTLGSIPDVDGPDWRADASSMEAGLNWTFRHQPGSSDLALFSNARRGIAIVELVATGTTDGAAELAEAFVVVDRDTAPEDERKDTDITFSRRSKSSSGRFSTHLALAGVADLIVVQERTLGYELGDVSHVENVLRGETKRRVVRQRVLIDETTSEETETSREEERELATTERNSLAVEASQVVSEQSAISASAGLTAKYGGWLEVTANGSYSMSTATEEAQRTATEHAQEVVDRAIVKVSERVRRERVQRVLRETQESNVHRLDATLSDDHVVGVYQWLTRVVQVEMQAYGERTMIDVIVPEPGAMLLPSPTPVDTEDEIEPPPPFTDEGGLPLTPGSIRVDNYERLVAQFRARGVSAPNTSDRFYTQTLAGAPGVDDVHNQRAYDQATIGIDEGYSVHTITVTGRWWGDTVDDDEGRWSGDVTVGSRAFHFDQDHQTVRPAPVSPPLSGDLGVTVIAARVSLWSVGIEVRASPDDESLADWRLETFDALRAAHSDWESLHQARVAQVEAEDRARAEDPGMHPLLLKKRMADEIRRYIVNLLLTREPGADMLVEETSGVDQAAHEEDAPLVRFIEQAFEWEHMQWILYPYFWASPERWAARLEVDSPDVDYREFLRSGAARAQLPVRPGFLRFVQHFLDTGEPWLGGGNPGVGDEGWVPFVEEQRVAEGGSEMGRPYGQPWEVRVPTSLVKVRPELLELPAWELREEPGPDGITRRWVDAALDES